MPLGDPLPSRFLFPPRFSWSGKGCDGRVVWVSELFGDRHHASFVSFTFCNDDCLWSPNLAFELPIFPRYTCFMAGYAATWKNTTFPSTVVPEIGTDGICPVLFPHLPSMEGECIPLPPPCWLECTCSFEPPWTTRKRVTS